MVTSIERGINGGLLRLNHQNLQTVQLQDDVGESLLHLMKHIPMGIVVFFPSYDKMELLTQRWIQNGTYDKMMNAKTVYMEPRGSDEEATQQFMDNIEKFGRDCGNIKYIEKYKRSAAYKKELKEAMKKKQKEEEAKKKKGSIHKYLAKKPITTKDYSFSANRNKNSQDGENEDIDLMELQIEGATIATKKGAAFFGVCRGKISEGIDFSDSMSRAVILLGMSCKIYSYFKLYDFQISVFELKYRS